jgi:hypothetical protein
MLIFLMRWTIGILLALIGLYAIAFNWVVSWRQLIMRVKAPSVVPIAGPFFIAAGLACLPKIGFSLNRLQICLLLLLFLDIGSMPSILLALLRGNFRNRK